MFVLIRPRSTVLIDPATNASEILAEASTRRREMRRTACKRVLALALAYAAFESMSAILAIRPDAKIIGVFSILGLSWACSSLFAKRRFTERVTIERNIVCVSHYVDDELVGRRRVKAIGVVRHIDDAGDCRRVEVEGVARQLEIARDVLPGEREAIVERLAAALREAGVEAPVRTVCKTPSCAASAAPAAPSERGAEDAPAKRTQSPWIACAAASALMVLPMLQATPQPRDAIAAPGKTAPAFRLTSSKGETVDDRTMLGRPYAIFFGFTKCPEACPATLLELTTVVKEAGADTSDFEILFVSLDAERDTPDVLSDFVGSFGGRVTGLRGSTDELARAAQAFRVYHRKVPLKGGGYTIDHTTLVYLVDHRGQLVDTLSFMEQADIASKRLKAFLVEAAAHGAGRSGRRRSRIHARAGAAVKPARRSRWTSARQPAALHATSGRWTLYRCYSASRSDTRGE
ncbi:SCO family protein [Methylocystis iwaonis]|uniref:Thioredoxin domain-containing protein n=1 Tax=Methylocystis iwaonis TaxID=2885079 RepID=A0ABM8E7X8_9HYPH|nr:SCO family protein [Methylocystis iwaonis]BDV34057.1 hypothetical protein SS37A_15860 [Methylocystis iwaonis]